MIYLDTCVSNYGTGAAHHIETSWRWTDFGSHKLADYITVKTALQYELLQALNQVKNQFGAPDTITVYTKHTYILNCLRKTGKLSELEVYILTTLEDINAQVEIKPAQNCDCMKQLKKLAEQKARTRDFDIPLDYDKYDKKAAKKLAKLETARRMELRYHALMQESETKILNEFFPTLASMPEYIEPEFVETQFFTGHGAFATYLKRFQRAERDTCRCHDTSRQTVTHVLL